MDIFNDGGPIEESRCTNGLISKLAVGGTGSHKHTSPGTGACFVLPPCSRSSQRVTLNPLSLPLPHHSMTLTPNDVFQIPPSTALEMAQGVMLTLNTIIRHLPERELREMRSSLEVSLCVVEDLLLGGTISSSFETLTINGGVYGSLSAVVMLIFPPTVTTTPSCVFTVANPRTAVTAVGFRSLLCLLRLTPS